MNHKFDLSTRRFLQAVAAGTAALAAGCAMRDPSKPPEEGFEYRAGGPWPTGLKGKLEVAEFFWYGCPFCRAFDPVLDAWASRQPPDVVFRKVHPSMRKNWEPQARLFFTLETMGKLKELNAKVFDALQVQQMPLDTRDEIARWAVGEGLDRADFLRVFDSREVTAKKDAANAMARAFKLDGVPALVVNGKWLTEPAMTGSRENTLRVVEYLLERERRAARGG